MGCSDGYVEEIWLLENLGDENKAVQMAELKKQALAKLSKEEKMALGLE
jgi:hypothetical protein